MESKQNDKSMIALGNAEKTVVAGGFAGVVSKTMTAPLSRMVCMSYTLHIYKLNTFGTGNTVSDPRILHTRI